MSSPWPAYAVPPLYSYDLKDAPRYPASTWPLKRDKVPSIPIESVAVAQAGRIPPYVNRLLKTRPINSRWNSILSTVVGGLEVPEHSIPGQVLLTNKRYPDYLQCGGTLISQRHVLTAAHCYADGAGNFDLHKKIYVGAHHVMPIDGTSYEWCRLTKHPNYNSGTKDNDFMIIHLKEPVELNEKVGLVSLPDTVDGMDGDFFVNKTLTVSGWGDTSPQRYRGYPDVLQSVRVPGISQSQCSKSYEDFHEYFTITDNMICAGDTVNGGIDSCKGDSGGNVIY